MSLKSIFVAAPAQLACAALLLAAAPADSRAAAAWL